MTFLPALAAGLSVVATVGTTIASATNKPPNPNVLKPPNILNAQQQGQNALRSESKRRGRASTILTGASTLLDVDEEGTSLLGG